MPGVGVLCPSGKIPFWNRKAAKRAARRQRGRHLSTYPCDAAPDQMPPHFHLGGKPPQLAQVGREAWRQGQR